MKVEALADLAEKKIAMSSGMLQAFRNSHLEVFKKNGFKTAQGELYKFTNLSRFFDELQYLPSESKKVLASYHDLNFTDIVFINGELQASEVKASGFTLKKLSDELPSLLDKQKLATPMTHLHQSFLNQGVVLEIEKNAVISKPIRLLNIQTRSGVYAPTIFIRVATNAQASILEQNIGEGQNYALSIESYVQLEANSQLEHVQVDQGHASSLHHSSSVAQIARDATYRHIVLHVTGKLNRTNLFVELLEEGGRAESSNLFLTNQTEHSDINTVLHHKAPDTTSAQIAKGILDGDSKGIFTGKIHIHPQSQRVVSTQLNKNLLLSKKAQIHSQPQLEIFADDVKCSHGSTTGQLSDDEVFYFEARGIPAEKARTILAHGFGLEVVLKIKNTVTRQKIEALVLETLKTKFQIGVAL